MTDAGKRRVKTGELLSALTNTSNLEAFLVKHDEHFIKDELSQYLTKLTDDREMVREHVILRARIDRNYGHQIYEGRRKPSRDKLIQLAFGLQLGEDETQRLLKVAGYSPLYPKIRRDAILLYHIIHKKTINDAQCALDLEGLSLLSKG